MGFELEAIGRVEALREQAEDDDWGGSRAWIELDARFPADALDGIETFSHVEVLFVFHRVDPGRVVTGARHPRDNPDWPAVGIFAQRGKGRPNRIGSTICRVLGRSGRRLELAELDAIDGTPVLDIKPVMRELLPREPVSQPAWSHELMQRYWSPGVAPDAARSRPSPGPLRSAHEADLPLLSLLMGEFHAESGFELAPDRTRPALAQLVRDPALGRVWLILAGEEPVGYVAICFGFSLEYYGRDGIIDEIYLRPAFRGAGLGARALEAAEAHCRELGIRALHLEVEHDNAAAQKLYRRLGYGGGDRHLLSKRLLSGDAP